MTLKIDPPTKQELNKAYNLKGATLSSLAREYKTSHPTVRSWLKNYGITLKTHKEASAQANRRNMITVHPSRDVLAASYANTSIDMLEKIFSVGQSTIYQWLKDYNIPLRNHTESVLIGKKHSWNNIRPNRNIIVEKYAKHGSIRVLSNELNISPNSVKKAMLEYDIPRNIPWRSSGEIALAERLEAIYPGWMTNDRTLISPLEIDIIHHEKKLAVEYCGLYWHSEISGEKARNYHREKFLKCAEAGYVLITVFETDRKEFINSLIAAKCGSSKRISARKTIAIDLDSKTARNFEETNHAHGGRGGSVRIGLIYGDELVMTLTMCKSRFDHDYEWECARMTVKNGMTIVGGASKLMCAFRKMYAPTSIVTYADLRFGNGKVYEKLGFTRVTDTPPNYWYFNKKNYDKIYSRQTFQKHKIMHFPVFDKKLSEHMIMALAGYDRIFDCGNAKYVWTAS